MTDPGQYTYDAHIRDADDMVVRHIANNPTLLARVHKKAWRDVRHELKANGYIDDIDSIAGRGSYNPGTLETQILPQAEPHNAFDAAEITVQFTAKTTGGLTVPAGTELADVDSDDANQTLTGARKFATSSELIVSAGGTGTVAAVAVADGAAYNLPDETALYLVEGDASLPTFSAAEVVATTTTGVDHQLTRAATYRALCLLYLDLVKQEGDAFDHKLKMYRHEYEAEMRLLLAGGIHMEIGTADGVEDEYEEQIRHGFHRFQRG